MTPERIEQLQDWIENDSLDLNVFIHYGHEERHEIIQELFDDVVRLQSHIEALRDQQTIVAPSWLVAWCQAVLDGEPAPVKQATK